MCESRATITVEFTSEKPVDILFHALLPEVKAPLTHRAIVKIEKTGCALSLVVDSEDIVSLRATLNAYLRWINSTLNVLEVVKEV